MNLSGFSMEEAPCWDHGSTFTEQPNFQEEMNPSLLWPQVGLGGSLGGGEMPDHPLQESLEPSHCLGSLFSTEGMCSLPSFLFCLHFVLLVRVPLPCLPSGTAGRGAGQIPQAARQRPEQEPPD